MAQEIARNTAGTEIAIPTAPKLSLPAWLNRSAYTLGTINSPDGKATRYLPHGMSLNSSQREEATAELRKVEAMLRCDEPIVVRAAVIGKLLASAVGATDKNASRARSDNYRDATDDIPVWAIAAAIKRWNRAEVTAAELGRAPNFDFAPSPPHLRVICMGITRPYREAVQALNDLLTAKPLNELLEESRGKSEAVKKGFETLSQSLSTGADLHKRPISEPLDVEAVLARGKAERDTAQQASGEE